MKIKSKTFNPLNSILSVIPNRMPELLTKEQATTIVALLGLGGVQCENNSDTLTCLTMLDELGILDVEIIDHGSTVSIKLGNKYNGK